eukprot:COSAG02_NODE_4377_length_5435_cov_3.316342_1_plen_23_part_10
MIGTGVYNWETNQWYTFGTAGAW